MDLWHRFLNQKIYGGCAVLYRNATAHRDGEGSMGGLGGSLSMDKVHMSGSKNSGVSRTFFSGNEAAKFCW